MPFRSLPARALTGAGLLLALALAVRSAFPLEPGLDYFADAGFPIDALVRGDWEAFAANPALMGNFSLFLRAPFVWPVFEQSQSVVYFAGAVPCLAAVAALGLWLRRRMLALGRPALAATLVALVAIVNPGVFRSLHWGHPEEFLAGALCVGAVIAAARARTLPAAVLLGLAVATKQWAVIAVIPVLLAAPGRHVRLAAVAGAVALAITLPSIVAGPGAFFAMQESAVAAEAVAGPPNVWWPFSSPRSAAAREASAPGFADAIPGWLGALSHPLIVLAGIPLGWLYFRRRARFAPEDALGLLALALLLRCLLDPWNIDYYHAPFLLALLAWEALARDGWPRMTLLAGAALALTFPASLTTMSAMGEEGLRYCLTYLAWALPLAGWLALALFAPGWRPARVAPRRRPTTAAPAT